MRIVTGSLKGRQIPSHRCLRSIRLTAAQVKEAAFSALGSADLEGQVFLDLCAGSGQMGLEAGSRGARVVLNEPDFHRWTQLRGLLRDWRVTGVQLHREKGQVLIERLEAAGELFDLVYVDPPYDALLGGVPLSLALLERLAATQILRRTAQVLVQHDARLALPESVGPWERRTGRRYGTTQLSTYSRPLGGADTSPPADPDAAAPAHAGQPAAGPSPATGTPPCASGPA